MIHELLLSPTETASGSHPCCVVSVTYHRPSYFHGGNTGSNPVGDANKQKHLSLLTCSMLGAGSRWGHDRTAIQFVPWAHNPKVGGSNPPPATNHSLSFQSLSFHPLNDLGPIESKIQALPTVSICPKRAAKTRPSCDIACVYPIVVRASDCPSRFWRVAIGTCS